MTRVTFLLSLCAAATLVSACKKDLCTPGQSIACVGVGACVGFQVCTADGSKFGDCQCGAAPDASTPDMAAPPDLAPTADLAPTPDLALPCAVRADCTAPVKDCIGLVENQGQSTFGLRMSQVTLSAPRALTTGILNTTIAGNAVPNLKSCNLSGAATFNWLLQFDTGAGTLRTGGAKPVVDATLGYSFDDEMITQGPATFHVQPVSFAGVTLGANGSFASGAGADLFLPVFLNDTGTSLILFPLHQLKLSGTVSATHDCIGRYNAAGLDPLNSCQPDGTNPQFLDAGVLEAYVTLEEADTIVVSPLSQTLCVMLSGDPATYGQLAGLNTVCKRDTNNHIVFRGDWCSMTNMAAANGCADSTHLTGTFAASSILLK